MNNSDSVNMFRIEKETSYHISLCDLYTNIDKPAFVPGDALLAQWAALTSDQWYNRTFCSL